MLQILHCYVNYPHDQLLRYSDDIEQTFGNNYSLKMVFNLYANSFCNER
jgi:hypothetical protein